jgi:hypothetical protein
METEKTEIVKFDLKNLFLKSGGHKERDAGVCLLEAVAWFAGEEHSDRPECVDVALAAYGRAFNDRCTDEERQKLTFLVPKLVGTKGSRELAKRRAYLLVDRHLRVIVPAFLRELPFRPQPQMAATLEALSPIVDAASARRARDVAREARAMVGPISYSNFWKWSADAVAAAAVAAAADAAAADAAAVVAAAAVAAAAVAAAADAAAVRAMRSATIDRRIAAFVEAIELTEDRP